MELSKQQPKVRFYYCTETKGLELIESIRRQKGPEEPAPDLPSGLSSSV
jgi:hypothetical protein